MTIERIEELRFKGEKEQQVVALLAACFSSDFEGRSFFQNRHHCRFLIWSGAKLVGHLALTFRAIQIGHDRPDGDRVDIIGLGEVAVAPKYRRQGVGTRLIEAALQEGQEAGAEFAVLFGEQSIYTKAGFVPAPNQLTWNEMQGAKTDLIVHKTHPYLMVRQLGERQWNMSTNIDLAGFPF